jgi:hypothetical protein
MSKLLTFVPWRSLLATHAAPSVPEGGGPSDLNIGVGGRHERVGVGEARAADAAGPADDSWSNADDRDGTKERLLNVDAL